jgi:hypothetical protein
VPRRDALHLIPPELQRVRHVARERAALLLRGPAPPCRRRKPSWRPGARSVLPQLPLSHGDGRPREFLLQQSQRKTDEEELVLALPRRWVPGAGLWSADDGWDDEALYGVVASTRATSFGECKRGRAGL